MSDAGTEIEVFVLGPLENNSYLFWEPSSGEAAVVDPSFGSESILEEIESQNLHLRYILLTHAHFDHIAGVNTLFNGVSPRPQILLHELELPLWHRKGAAMEFGISIPELPEPTGTIGDGESIPLGNINAQALLTPGHTPGHVIYSLPTTHTVFTGDLIFFRGVGRTDLMGGNSKELYKSIDTKILTLPSETRLLSGHGPATTVGDEIKNNPFL